MIIPWESPGPGWFPVMTFMQLNEKEETGDKWCHTFRMELTSNWNWSIATKIQNHSLIIIVIFICQSLLFKVFHLINYAFNIILMFDHGKAFLPVRCIWSSFPFFSIRMSNVVSILLIKLENNKKTHNKEIASIQKSIKKSIKQDYFYFSYAKLSNWVCYILLIVTLSASIIFVNSCLQNMIASSRLNPIPFKSIFHLISGYTL